MIIMKKIVLLATILAITALTSCTEDTYVGEQNLKAINEGAISFGSATPAVTRASGGEAAGLLNNNFVLFGYKTLSSETQTVFDNYQVNYVANTAHTTESNTADWEYVSYKNLPYGTTTTENGTLNDQGVAANATASGIEQSIKYWDFSATKYDFFAYSLGAGVTDGTTWAKASKLDKTGYGEGSTNPGYTLEGTKAQLGTCYISNKKTVNPAIKTTQVQLQFLSFLSKIRVGFYETIPGYSVKELTFYESASTKSTGSSANDGLKATLYDAGGVGSIPDGGKYTITFDDSGKPNLELNTTGATYTSSCSLGALNSYAAKEYQQADGEYLGRSSNAATYAYVSYTDADNNEPFTQVLPNPNGTALTLKVDFTLVSRDKTGETIEVKGATATVPAAYTQWKPNYAYTYIFKISDDTNAQSGTVTGLYPITLDAVVTDNEDGRQVTITTVSELSITTYQKGEIADEYNAGNIYVVVKNGRSLTLTGDNTNAKLYTAEINKESGDNPREPAQGITEATVANALALGGSVVDANGATLTVTPVATTEETTDRLQAIPAEGIPASDTPDGKALVVKGAWFKATAGKTYVFEYSILDGKYTQEEANEYNAELPGAITTSDVAYSFTSYSSKTGTPVVYGTGKVKKISQDGLWTTVLVTSNIPNDANAANFVGRQFKVNATTLNTDTYYQLYPTEGETPLPVYVKVNTSTFTETDVNTYNATLTGAKTTSDDKTAAKHYKVIKVVAP